MKSAAESDPEAKPPKPKRRWLRGCALVALGVLFLLMLSAGGWVLHLRAEQRKLAMRVSELLAEIKAGALEVGDAENAGLMYKRASALARDLETTGPLWKQFQEDQNFDFRSAPVVDHLDRNREYLAALAPITRLPKCSFQPDFAMGVAHLEPPPRELVQAGVLLTLAAGNAASSGHPDKAFECVGMGLRIADHLGQDQTLFCRMFQSHTEKTVASGVESILRLSEPDVVATTGLLREMGTYCDGRQDFTRMLRISRVTTMRTLEKVLAGEERLAGFSEEGVGADLAAVPAEGIWRWTGAGYRGAEHLDRAFDELISSAARPSPYLLDSMKALAEQGRPPTQSPSFLSGEMFVALSLGAEWRVLELSMQKTSRLDAARLGLGCRLHRLKFGAYPEVLADLSAKLPEHFKELPADPFTGKPFLYKRTAAGCVIWSVGADRVDDSGDPKKDTVFELKR
ncbi:MAG TPA: hypothetical protein PK280_05380 [Planctomycetota bacterium]|nr:hypothetical protein [Planctomycetota bacterium]